mmetsp:Transcript_18886/g.39301  ORF Transcript_18886/g.39301 Transcript_18886/m.39301 type:complete len:242 (+) Transcript_18886:6-731(+)
MFFLLGIVYVLVAFAINVGAYSVHKLQRRAFLFTALTVPPTLAIADEEDTSAASNLYTQGTDTSSELKSRTISTSQYSYQVPSKWQGDGPFIDISYPDKPSACTSLSVMKLGADVSLSDLGGDVNKICEAFDVPATTPDGTLTDKKNKWKGIDLIAGAKRTKDGRTYYDYDLAYAPSKCDNSGVGANLGLGFCPYQMVFVVSGCDGYGFQAKANAKEWKVGNGDIKGIRASWTVNDEQTDV